MSGARARAGAGHFSLSNHVQRLGCLKLALVRFSCACASPKEKDEGRASSGEIVTLLLPVSGSSTLLSLCGLGALMWLWQLRPPPLPPWLPMALKSECWFNALPPYSRLVITWNVIFFFFLVIHYWLSMHYLPLSALSLKENVLPLRRLAPKRRLSLVV